MPTKVQQEQLLTVRLAHLQMIQAIISRLATFSANAKNFCITIVAAMVGITFQQHLPLLLGAAAFVIVAFAALDVYYLSQERRFREFYTSISLRALADAGELDLAPPKLTLRQYALGISSFSTGGFYLLLLIAGAVLLPIAYDRREEAGVGDFSRAASSAAPQRPGQPAALAVGAGAQGLGAAAGGARTTEGPGSIGTKRSVSNVTTSATDRRNVRQPVATSNK